MSTFKKFRTYNICVKSWKNIPLFSIRWSENKIELLLFRFIPLLCLSSYRNYVQEGDNVWVAM